MVDISSLITADLNVSPGEARKLLARIFAEQPSCSPRRKATINTNIAQAESTKLCPPAIMLWGGAGTGKSDIVFEAAQDAGIPYDNIMDVRLSTLEPVDIRGIPSVEYGRTTYNPPSFFPVGTNEVEDAVAGLGLEKGTSAKEALDKIPTVRKQVEQKLLERYEHQLRTASEQNKGVLFFDELPSASQDVQVAAYEIILDRKVGKYTIPISWSIIAAGNRKSEGVSSYLPVPLANRMLHLSVQSTPIDWSNWALTEGGIDPVVIGFGYNELIKDPSQLHDAHGFDANEGKSSDQLPAFLSPRSLTWLDYINKQIDSGLLDTFNLPNDSRRKEQLEKTLYRSAIGVIEGTLFSFWKANQEFLLTGAQIWDHPNDAKMYFKILAKSIDTITESDINTLAHIKAKVSNEKNAQPIIDKFNKSFKSSILRFSGPLTTTFYPTSLVLSESSQRLRSNTYDRKQFLDAISSIIEITPQPMLGIIEGMTTGWFKNVPRDKLVTAMSSKKQLEEIIDNIRKNK